MATSFPGSLDNITQPHGSQSGGTDQLNTAGVVHGTLHQNEVDAIQAIEAKLGIDNSSVTSSIDYLLKSTSSLNPGHKHSTGSITGLGAAATENLGGNIIDDGSGNLTIASAGVTNAMLANNSITLNTHSVALGGSLSLTATDIGLGNVTNDTQTKAAIVPNTAPSAGQIFIGNAGNTAYAPQSISGSGATISLSATGVMTISAIANASLSNSAITIAGTSTALGGSISQDTITGLSSTGLIKRTGANTLAIASSGTDYAPATSGSSILSGNGSGGFSNVTPSATNLSFSGGTLNTIQNINTTASPQFTRIGLGTAAATNADVNCNSIYTNQSAFSYSGSFVGRVTTAGTFFNYGQQIDAKISVLGGQNNPGAGRGMFNNLLRNFDSGITNDNGTLGFLYGISTHSGHFNQQAFSSPTTTEVDGFYNTPYILSGVITTYKQLNLNSPIALAAPATWAATTAYTTNISMVKPSVSNGFYFVSTTGGTSGGSEPTWVTGVGNTTNDGSVVWTAVAIPTITNFWGVYQADSTARNFFNGRTLIGTTTDDGTNKLQIAGSIATSGKIAKYNNISTAGQGVPSIYGAGRSTGQTAAVASVASYTVGASDGSFLVSANANITAFTAGTFNVTVAYTDETNTAQTLKLNFSTLTGTLGITLAAAGPFEGIPAHIRCKAGTTITMATSGTFTSLTYNVEGVISQIQ